MDTTQIAKVCYKSSTESNVNKGNTQTIHTKLYFENDVKTE